MHLCQNYAQIPDAATKKVINIPPFIIVHRCTRSKALCVPTCCGMNAVCTRRGKCEKAGPRDLSIMNKITVGFGQ